MTTTSRPKRRKAFTHSGLTAILAAGLLAASCSTTTDEANPEAESTPEAEIATGSDGNASTEADGNSEEAGAADPAAEGEALPDTDDPPSVSIVVDPSAGQPILDSEDAALDHDGVLSCANIELAYISNDIGDEAGVYGSMSTAIDLGASSAVRGMNDIANNLAELSKDGLFADEDSAQLEAALATCIDLGYAM